MSGVGRDERLPRRGRLLGLDLGSKRVGVSVCDASQRIATGVTTIERRGDEALERRAVAGLVDEYEVVGVVVGLPLSLSGEIGAAAQAALDEAARLSAALDVPVTTFDERLSTVSAAAALRTAGYRAREQRAVIDKAAAAVLLQAWIDARASGNEETATPRKASSGEGPVVGPSAGTAWKRGDGQRRE